MGALKSKSACEKTSVSEPSTPRKRPSDPSSIHNKRSDSNTMLLKPHQKHLLLQAWKNINKEQIGKMVLRKMLSKAPEIKEVFKSDAAHAGQMMGCGMIELKIEQQHAVHITELLDIVIKNLNKVQFCDQKCREFGIAHSHLVLYGMQKDYWDVFGQAIAESSREWQGLCRHRELLRAWTTLGSFIVDRMREGYECGIRERRRSDALLKYTMDVPIENRPRSTSMLANKSNENLSTLVEMSGPLKNPAILSINAVQSQPASPLHGDRMARSRSHYC